MYKPVLFINIGLPGSGKSTFCENHMRHFPIISRDRIRFSLLKDKDAYFSNEKEVFGELLFKIDVYYFGIRSSFVDGLCDIRYDTVL